LHYVSITTNLTNYSIIEDLANCPCGFFLPSLRETDALTIANGIPLTLPTSGIAVTIPAALKFYAFCSGASTGDC
jgi:hypothetical protein